jgi:hypothetical protein
MKRTFMTPLAALLAQTSIAHAPPDVLGPHPFKDFDTGKTNGPDGVMRGCGGLTTKTPSDARTVTDDAMTDVINVGAAGQTAMSDITS